jgi:hypothetical protein
LNKLFTDLGGKFKFSAQDSDLEYLFWQCKNHPVSSDLKPPLVKVDYFDFPCEIFEILCEFDVRVIACNFYVFGFFLFFSDFFRSNSFIFEP